MFARNLRSASVDLQLEPIKDICGGKGAFVRMSKESISNLSARGSPSLYFKVLIGIVAKSGLSKTFRASS